MTMTHPDLPEQPITVREQAIGHYQAAGWQVDEGTPTKRRPRTAATRRRQTGDES
ncbi:hypothetical protein [Streptomyces sp. NBC_00986]|uniref:hypothetical protein n=1 Tax=Streptomyces sp. NBC_00986 TaxID=2903702 RepID=UPI003868DCAC|nr:hypothetical protein OG504_45115 [Streptomyces sp. NBC_00986]